jgi:hypothetical protein
MRKDISNGTAMSSANNVPRDDQTIPGRSVPNFIVDCNFFTSPECFRLVEAAGWEGVGRYHALVALLLKNPSYISVLKTQERKIIASALGMRPSSFETLLRALTAAGLMSDSSEIFQVSERISQYKQLCEKNRKNKTERESANPSEVAKEVLPLVNESSTSPTPLPLHSPPLNSSFGKGTGENLLPAVKPIGPKTVLAQLGEINVEALRMRFRDEGLADSDLREAIWHAAAKLNKDPKFDAYSWITRFGPEHARNAAASKARLEKAQTKNGGPPTTNFQKNVEILQEGLKRGGIL